MNDFSNGMRDLARKHAEAMREKAQERARKRKEEYLGARVSRELRDRVFRCAEQQNIPVSLLLRQVLEQAFPSDEKDARATFQGVSSPSQPGMNDAEILAWNEVRLGRSVSCQSCKTRLEKGSVAMMGLSDHTSDQPILCEVCFKNL
ncbi:MAG: hypothetical protein D6698_12145 [Gammaproteobacteria bacterium]|nr:MAG: hypothetical protein D6698_12145 [Gammaproteobacteria bacterium]